MKIKYLRQQASNNYVIVSEDGKYGLYSNSAGGYAWYDGMTGKELLPFNLDFFIQNEKTEDYKQHVIKLYTSQLIEEALEETLSHEGPVGKRAE